MSKTKPITIRQLNFSPIWSYGSDNRSCSICQNKLEESCNRCLTEIQKEKISKKCNIARGLCGHHFHFHCIQKWLETSESCPNDALMWKYDTENLDAKNFKQIVM